MSQVQQTEPAIEVLVPLEGATEKVEGRTPWQLFWTRFKRDRIAVGAAVVVLILITLAFTAPAFSKFIVHRGPNDLNQDYTSDISVPSWARARSRGSVSTASVATSSSGRSTVRGPPC